MKQQPEHLPARAIGLVGGGLVVLTVLLSAFAWWLVRPSPAYLVLPPTPLEHDVYTGEGFAGSAELDRDAAIEAAIDAVVNDPSLIGGRK